MRRPLVVLLILLAVAWVLFILVYRFWVDPETKDRYGRTAYIVMSIVSCLAVPLFQLGRRMARRG